MINETKGVITRSKKLDPHPQKQSTHKSKSKSNKNVSKLIKIGPEEEKMEGPDYSVQVEGTKYKVKVHKVYEVEIESELGKNIKNWIHMLIKKEQFKKGKIYHISHFTYYPNFEFALAQEKPEHEKCSICQFEYETLANEEMEKELVSHNSSDLVMLKCSHIMHYECLKSLIGDKEWMKCPVCSTIFGKMIGDQPDGVMTWSIDNSVHCEGYNDCGTIHITYTMNGGTRGNVNYRGIMRYAYLPDNAGGQEVLRLLKEAFDRKLIFTVGRSVTTGKDNVIVWNGVHHKTNTQGGSAYFGYPDPTYFDRVKLELASKGIY